MIFFDKLTKNPNLIFFFFFGGGGGGSVGRGEGVSRVGGVLRGGRVSEHT